MILALMAWSTLVFGITGYVVVSSHATLLQGLLVWTLSGPVFVLAMVGADLAQAALKRWLGEVASRGVDARLPVQTLGALGAGVSAPRRVRPVVQCKGIDIQLPADARVAPPEVPVRARRPRQDVRAATTGVS